jgi:hypothetical protein
VLYRSNAGLGDVEVAMWLGVSHRVDRLDIGNSNFSNDRPTNDERKKFNEETRKRTEQYEESLHSTFDAKSGDLTKSLRDVLLSLIIDPEDEDQSFCDNFTRVIEDTTLKHANEKYAENVEVTSDPYEGIEMAIVRGADGETVHAKVRKRMRDYDGAPIGVAHSNPSLDSSKDEVEYVDGHVEELTANVIAENIVA